MNFEEKDIELCIDGMGIAFYSPENAMHIPEGSDFLNTEYSEPGDVAAHIRKGDIVGFCTGTGGDFTLKFREGEPDEKVLEEYPLAIALGIEVKGDKLCMVDLFWLMEWDNDIPDEQILPIKSGYYHIIVCTRRPESGYWGDSQTIYMYMRKTDTMPEIVWPGVPQLCKD